MKLVKKIVSVMLSLSLCASLAVPALAADANCATCGGTGKVLSNTKCDWCFGYGSYGTIDWATGGLKQETCSSCGGTGYVMTNCPDCGGISPEECTHEHFSQVLAVEPTCTSSGRYDKVCSDCNTVLQEHYGRDPVPTAHQYVPTVVKEATCTEDGLVVNACSVCGARQNNSQEKVEALGHDMVNAGPGTEEGTIRYECSRCDEAEEIACEHEHYTVDTKAATCTTAGKTVKTCTDCGLEFSTTPINATGHEWGRGVMVGGNQTVTYTCANCGKTRTEQGAPKDEVYDREVDICMGFQTADGASFKETDIPEDFSVVYTYEWEGETYTVELNKDDCSIKEMPRAYEDENGELCYDEDDTYIVVSWKVKVPVDPTTGEPMQGTVLNVKESGYDIEGYEWDHAYGYNPDQSTDGTGVLYVPSDGTPVTWVYNVYAKTGSYTINYFYGGTLANSTEGTARVGSTIPLSFASSTTYEGRMYTLSRVDGNGAIGDDETVINVYYTLYVAPAPTPVPDPGEIEIEDEDIPLAGLFTRGDAIGYLWEQSGSPEWELSDFEDVPEDHEWAVAIGWAQEMGIAVADEDGNFRPDDLVLRYVEDLEIDPEGEFQEFLNRYAVYAGIELDADELFIELGGEADDIIMGEDAQVIFDDFFAKLEAALAQAA